MLDDTNITDCKPASSIRGALILVLPLCALAALVSYFAGLGIRREWLARMGEAPPWRVEFIVSAALHLSWIFCIASRRGSFAAVLCWFASLYACNSGMAGRENSGGSVILPFIVECVPLLLARSLSCPPPLSETLARWRRARTEISIQLRMGEGLISWFPPALRQFFIGSPKTQNGSSYRRFIAELADAEHCLRLRLGHLTLPEHLRQSILTSAAALVSQAEKSAAALAIELEREALEAVAACRDQCEELRELQPQEKAALAKQCEDLFLELVQSAQPLARAV